MFATTHYSTMTILGTASGITESVVTLLNTQMRKYLAELITLLIVQELLSELA